MSQNFPTPTDWKSAAWWRNRSNEERLFHAKIPARFRNMEVDIPPVAAHWINNYEEGNSLFIHGKPGTGKTVLAQEVMRHLIAKGMSARFVSADQYIEMLKDTFDSDNLLPEMYSSPYLVKYIQGVFDVVLLDGVGQERETEFSVHEIGSLIRRRYENVRSVIVTTTLGITDFNRRYGDRVKSAVLEMGEVRVS
jgi:DNA replication protein DnaC